MWAVDRRRMYGAAFLVLVVLVGAWVWASPLLVGWPVALYVCWRAVPGIRSDFQRIRLRFFPDREWRI